MPYFTKSPGTDRENKNLQIYSILRNKKEVSRADLTAITGINPVSISNYTNSFIKHGLIVEKEIGLSSGGRPPIILELNNSRASSIGIHVDSKQLKCVVMSSDMQIHKKFSIEKTDQDIFTGIVNVVNTVIESLSKDDIKSVFIAIEDMEKAQVLTDQLEESLSFPIYFCDVSVAGAYNEKVAGNLFNEETSFIFAYKDIGQCSFLKGDNIYTENDTHEDQVYEYFKAWDDSLSIISCAKRVLTGGEQNNKEEFSTKESQFVFEAAKKGDKAAIEILEFVALNLSVRLSYLINILRPNKVIIDGQISCSQDIFINSLKKGVKTLVSRKNIDEVEIIYGESDPFSIATGTAGLGVRQLFIGG